MLVAPLKYTDIYLILTTKALIHTANLSVWRQYSHTLLCMYGVIYKNPVFLRILHVCKACHIKCNDMERSIHDVIYMTGTVCCVYCSVVY